MREIILKANKQREYEIIKKVSDGNMNKSRAIAILCKNKRHVNRMIKGYREFGKIYFLHKNTNKVPANKKKAELDLLIVLLYKNIYRGFNIKHFYSSLKKFNIQHKKFLEKLTPEIKELIKKIDLDEEEFSYKYVFNLINNRTNMFSPRIHKRTLHQKQKNWIAKKLIKTENNEIVLVDNKEISGASIHPRKEKEKYFGEVIEIDGSIHNWLPNDTKKYTMHLAVDRATSAPLGAWFEEQETLQGYYRITNIVLQKHGIPLKFVTDNRTVFNYNSLTQDRKKSRRDTRTQFQYACDSLGIDIWTTSVPQQKGLIETTNGTFQDRLINEIKLLEINSVETLNDYVNDFFIPEYQKELCPLFNKIKSVFDSNITQETINNTLSVICPRVIDGTSSIRYDKKYYQLFDQEREVFFQKGTNCLIIKNFKGVLFATVGDVAYNLVVINKVQQYSENLTEQKIFKKREKYKPPVTHPWRYETFIRVMERNNKKVEYSD